MDQEIMEYLDRKLLGLTTKEDLEKLRQETKSNFRQLREENKNQILEWRQEIKAVLEQVTKESRVDLGPVQEEINRRLEKSRMETQSDLDQSIRIVESSLHKIGEEIKIGFDQRKQEMESSLQLIKEGEINNIASLIHETGSDIDELKAGINGLREEIKKTAEEIVGLNKNIGEGLVEVREELGSMMKFSHADLEKKFNALEARIKALEKMVFP
jgi:uncharacterized protein YdhG (YjbR/CyaY superfamily)